MNTQHPITPPQELVEKWINMFEFHLDAVVLTEVAQWGADQELEACCEWLESVGLHTYALRAARRPKLPSLKEQALGIIDDNIEDGPAHISFALEEIKTIRQALEALDD